MPKTKFICQQCGNKFERWASSCKDGIAKYCSLKCNGLAKKDKETDNRKKIKCDYCDKEFLIYNWQLSKSEKHFCSPYCNNEFRSRQIKIDCECCGKSFKVKKARYELFNPRFCSWGCRSRFLKGKEHFNFTSIKKVCLECGNEFYAKISEIQNGKGLFCSNECYYNNMKLDRPSDSNHFYGTSFWRELREDCYKRDEYTCKKCGSKENLHAHHKKPRRLNGEDKLENLITLCASCHTKIEKRYKLKRNIL